MAKITTSFSLDDRADKDILTWLDGLPKRQKSAAIREALRIHLREQSITLTDIYQAIKELDRKLANGAVVADTGELCEADIDEPPDAAAALDQLGL